MNNPTLNTSEADGETILEEILTKKLDDLDEEVRVPSRGRITASSAPPINQDEKSKTDKENHVQWALGGNGRFTPVGSTIQRLPAGIYEPFATPGMWGLEATKVVSDGIYMLPDMATDTVLDEVKKFWASEDRYRKHKLLYKRGIILWGPPGGGKTVAVKLLMNELVQRDGIVIIAMNIQLAVMCLKAIRRIEPGRNLIIVLEDIDEIIQYNGEAGVLSLLDGESNVDNILHLATTNYPERLGPRIINRPSRFDRRVFVGMPEPKARQVYLEKATGCGLDKATLALWVKDTEDMSIAHMRELVAAVYCLDQPYDDVINRLKAMAKAVKPVDGMTHASMGFKTKP